MGDLSGVQSDLAQLVRLVIAEQYDDVRLYVARLVRKYRDSSPELAAQLDQYLRSKPANSHNSLRKASSPAHTISPQPLPVDDESRLSLLKTPVLKDELEKPVLSEKMNRY